MSIGTGKNAPPMSAWTRSRRSHEGGECLALRCDQRLLKGDALVARQHRLTRSDHPVAVPHRRRDMGDFIPARLALPRRAAKLSKCFQEKRLGISRLYSSRF